MNMFKTIGEFIQGCNRQEYYKQGRQVKSISREEIEGYCKCGYITLKPRSDFEEFNNGLTIKRSKVKIYDGSRLVKRLVPRRNDIMRWWCCNACGNNWK